MKGALACGLVVLAASGAFGQATDVKVTTDTSIDCTSVQTMARRGGGTVPLRDAGPSAKHGDGLNFLTCFLNLSVEPMR